MPFFHFLIIVATTKLRKRKNHYAHINRIRNLIYRICFLLNGTTRKFFKTIILMPVAKITGMFVIVKVTVF